MYKTQAVDLCVCIRLVWHGHHYASRTKDARARGQKSHGVKTAVVGTAVQEDDRFGPSSSCGRNAGYPLS